MKIYKPIYDCKNGFGIHEIEINELNVEDKIIVFSNGGCRFKDLPRDNNFLTKEECFRWIQRDAGVGNGYTDYEIIRKFVKEDK